MRYEIIIKYVGIALMVNAVFMFISFILSLFFSEPTSLIFLYSTVITFGFGIIPAIYVKKAKYLTIHEGVMIVVMGWLATCLTGLIPYVLWGNEFTFVNAFFESVSGYTTTGSTILSNIESLPMSMIFWRSSTHWIGGIGIILFALLILPESGTARLILFKTEVSQLAQSNFASRAKEILNILVFIYLGLTILEVVLLCLAGMSLFDSVNHAFATVATGGFSTKDTSIAFYDNIWIEIIIMVFMVLSGIHFGLIFNVFSRNKNNIFKSSAVRAYVLFLTAGILLVSVKLYLSDTYGFADALRYSSFQVISLGTTTGFATADSSIWPGFTHIILIYFTIQCAMVGSTSGGMKFDRVWLFLKTIAQQIKQMQHPKAVLSLKIDGKPVADGVVKHTMVFIAMYLVIILITTAILTSINVDNMTAFSASAATLGNVGPGFNGVGSMTNFGSIPDLGKIVLSANMLLGRLEIFGILSLFFIRSWR